MLADWTISPDAIANWRRLVDENKGKKLPRSRRARNVTRTEALDLSREAIWRVLVGCQVTTQQRSGPGTPASRFMHSSSPVLSLAKCAKDKSVQELIESECTRAGLRRARTISNNLARILSHLKQAGAWKQLLDHLATLQSHTNLQKERKVIAYLRSGDFPGLGPKQARNFLQWVGLSRYEVPLDSRVLKRLRELGANFVPRGAALSDEVVYMFVQDLIQRIAKEVGLYPCELDACIFASFDDESIDDSEDAVE